MSAAVRLLKPVAMVAAGVLAGPATLVGGLMIAGGALSAAGAISGNQRLNQFGSLLGLAGGVGGLATGAWSTAADQIAGNSGGLSSITYGENAANMGGGLEGASGLGAGSLAGSTVGASDVLGGASSLSGLASSAVPGASALETAPGAIQPTGMGAAPQLAGASPMAQAPIEGAGYNVPAVNPTPAATDSGGILGYGQRAVNWMTASPANARVTQAAAGLIGGAMSGLSQQEALRTQIALQEGVLQRARDRLNASIKGIPASAMPTYTRPGG